MLKTKEILYGLDDICIIPAAVSDIRSRKECNPYHENKKLPIFASPMTAVVSEDNLEDWNKNDIIPIIPRNIELNKRLKYATSGTWAAFSLDEFEEYFVKGIKELKPTGPIRALIDIANGHMKVLLNLIPESKVGMRLEYGHDVDYEIMAGNIANPETYRNLALVGCDYVRCSIGSGNCCITASSTAVHYPLGTLISKCYEEKCKHDLSCKIIADGGINSFNRINTALALGADYVMIGSLFASMYESAAEFNWGEHDKDEDKLDISCTLQATNADYNKFLEHFYYLLKNGKVLIVKNNNGLPDFTNARMVTPSEDWKKKIVQSIKKMNNLKSGYYDIHKGVFGMSTRQAQQLINKEGTKKTSEGIAKSVYVDYTLAQWTDNFKSYLKSAMSYCGKRTLYDFIGEVETGVMSPVAKDSFNK